MTIKVYISGICGSQEVRKNQQRVLFILESLPIDLQVIDVTEPGKDDDLIFMQETAKKHNKKSQLPPQIFNDNEYCGDFTDFDLANDDDEIMKFLKLETGPSKTELLSSGNQENIITQNGISNHENEKEGFEQLEMNNSNEIEDDTNKKQNDSDILMSDEKDAKDTENKIVPEDKVTAEEESKEQVTSEEEEESE